jgi:dienelactone hydrolase
MVRLLLIACLVVWSGLVSADIKGEVVTYQSGDTVMKGYLAYDAARSGKRPGVLVVHEWWGLNDYARKRAHMLAKLGYTALAVDMYGNGKTAGHPDDAGKFAGEVKKNMAVAEARFKAALELLKQQPTVDDSKIAAIGYCFGGGIVLEMARRGVDLDAVVSFHGSLGTASPAKRGDIKARILVANGADDPFTKPEQIEAFKKEMDAADADYKFINYPGARHAFTNPGADEYGKKFNLPMAYNQAADKASWKAMKQIFSEVFQ